MPRKTDPHWYDDGENLEYPVALNAASVESLAVSIGLVRGPEEEARLLEALTTIGQDFRSRHNFASAKFSRAEARKALVEFRGQGDFSYTAILSLNARAWECLFDQLSLSVPLGNEEGSFLLNDLTQGRIRDSVIQNAATSAIFLLDKTKGQEPKTEVLFAVERLCHLYQDLTGVPVTHSNKDEDLQYAQAPKSNAGRFVRGAFDIFDVDVPDTHLNIALRLFVALRRK